MMNRNENDQRSWIERLLAHFIARAEGMKHDEDALNGMLNEAAHRARTQRSALIDVLSELLMLVRLVRCWVSGTYRDISGHALVLILAALLYLVSPIDFVPDFIPVFGYVDDALILGAVAAMVADEMEKFKAWERG